MAQIEVGKYYMDLDGFYKCVGKQGTSMNKRVQMDAVMVGRNSLSFQKEVTYVEGSCEKNMVECSKEDYDFAFLQADSTCCMVNRYHTAVLGHSFVIENNKQ